MLTIRQLIDAAVKAKRGLTLVTSSAVNADRIADSILMQYMSLKQTALKRGFIIDGVVIRVQVGHSIPTVYNVWHV